MCILRLLLGWEFFVFMNIKNKKIIIIFTILAVTLVFGVFFIVRDNRGFVKSIIQDRDIVEKDLPQKISKAPVREIISVPEVASQDKEDIQNEIKATLVILGQTYNVAISEGENVYELMSFLSRGSKEEPRFDFKAREHQGLGYFVYEINGIKGKSGAYWIYYINGEEANVGVSKYIVKDGDVIEWKQE